MEEPSLPHSGMDQAILAIVGDVRSADNNNDDDNDNASQASDDSIVWIPDPFPPKPAPVIIDVDAFLTPEPPRPSPAAQAAVAVSAPAIALTVQAKSPRVKRVKREGESSNSQPSSSQTRRSTRGATVARPSYVYAGKHVAERPKHKAPNGTPNRSHSKKKTPTAPFRWVPPLGIDNPVRKYGPSVHRSLPVVAPVPAAPSDPAGPITVPQSLIRDMNIRSSSPTGPGPTTLAAVARACEVRVTENRGRGLIAMRNLKAGEIVMAEEPIIKARRNADITELMQVVSRLSHPWLLLLLSFESSGGYLPALEGIMTANGIPCVAEDDTDEDHEDEAEEDGTIMGVFEFISRINHSCSPNATWTWTEVEQRMLLIACQPIAKGEELLAWYPEPDVLLQPRKKRREVLKDLVKFDCACSVCDAPTADVNESDRRRARISAIIARWKSMEFDNNFFADRDILHEAAEAGQLAHIERLVHPLVDIFLYQFYVYAAWRRHEQAKIAAKCAFRALVCTIGRHAAQKHFIAQWSKDPSQWGSYGFMVPQGQLAPVGQRPLLIGSSQASQDQQLASDEVV